MKKKRLLALLLVLCMTLSLLPFSAFAEEAGDGEQGEPPVTGDPAPVVYNSYNVTINYLMSDGSIAAAPYIATLAEGSDFSASANNPVVIGYEPTEPTAVSGISFTYTAAKIDWSVTGISQAYDINVYYIPAIVNYKVQIKLQNANDDGYTDGALLTKTGYTGDLIADVTESYEGFEQITDYEKPEIAADGSTTAEVQYDRKFYHMTFDLDGGYGVDPIYDRYGATVSVPNPTKVGYNFTGWSPAIPENMPNQDTSYTATWSAEENASSFTVFYWYENADDTEYSLAGSKKITNVKAGDAITETVVAGYTTADFDGKDSIHFIYDHAVYDETIAGDGSSAINLYYARKKYTLAFYMCGRQHEHTAACYDYTVPTCGKTEHLAHTKECYGISSGTSEYTGELRAEFEKAFGSLVEGRVYRYRTLSPTYYLFIGGKLYKYSSAPSGRTETRTESHRYDGATRDFYEYSMSPSDSLHTHDSSCYGGRLTCTKEVHTEHDGINCYRDSVEDTLIQSFERKWMQNVSDIWQNGVCGNPVGTRWKIIGPTAPDSSNMVTVYSESTGEVVYSSATSICVMLTMADCDQYFGFESKGNRDLRDMSYYIETLDGNGERNYTYDGETLNYTLKYHYDAYYGSIGNKDEFVSIAGFEQVIGECYSKYGYDRTNSVGFLYPYPANPDRSIGSAYHADFYYARKSYDISFVSNGAVVKTGTEKFEASLADYAGYEPSYPAGFAPGAYEFAGWYLSEGGGAAVDLSTATMPVEGLTVYALWIPATIEVTIDIGEDTITDEVTYGSTLDVELPTPTKEGYEFIGWYYTDGNGVERAFDPESTPITGSIELYPKWRGGKVTYTIYYKCGDIEIAAPTTGKASADTTKTFEAKGGDDLYTDYREGYFPVTPSHNVKLSADTPANNVYTFQYQEAEAVPYTVRYLEEGTNNVLATAKTVSGNRKAVVTETFEAISGYLPDQFQKRLVVSVAEDAVNEIIFYYHVNTEPVAPYRISHYTQNMACTGYDEKQHSETTGNIGERYPVISSGSSPVLSLDGFTCVRVEFIVAGVVKSTVTENIASATYELPDAGLEICYLYDRIKYPYEVRYAEQGGDEFTDLRISDTAPYQKQVPTTAKTIPGYTPVGQTSRNMTIMIEDPADVAKNNVITYFYNENRPKIKYEIVGDEGCASLNRSEESVGAVTGYNKTGAALGATVTVNDNYKLIGWYTDADCTQAAATAENDPATVVPAKGTDGLFATSTYYAKVAGTCEVYFTSTGTTESVVIGDDGKLDLTKLVHNGYLYGGYYTDSAMTTAGTVSGAARPTDPGTTLYLREIKDTDYFKPRLLVTSLNDVHRAFLLTVTDNEDYSSFGFDISGLATKSVSTTAVTEQLSFTTVGYTSKQVNYGLAQIRPNSNVTVGKLVVIELSGYNALEPTDGAEATGFSIVPYFVTLDGVKVSCPTTRTITPNGTVYPNVTDTVNGVSEIKTVTTAPTTGSPITVYESITPYAGDTAQALIPNGGAPAIPELSEEEPEPEVIEEEAPAANAWQNFFNGIGNALKNIFG